jgi:CheY-like chemotaxis protein
VPSTGTILVVDDRRDDVDLLLRTFKQIGVANRIKVCESGEDALEYLSTHPLPALMLLDLKMPGKDGFDVLHEIKRDPELKDLIVIVLTTSSDLHDIKRAYALGANSFLTKPFDLDEFREMVRAFHGYWVLQNNPTPKRRKRTATGIAAV